MCEQNVSGVGNLVPLVQQRLPSRKVKTPAVVPWLPASGEHTETPGGKTMMFNTQCCADAKGSQKSASDIIILLIGHNIRTQATVVLITGMTRWRLLGVFL